MAELTILVGLSGSDKTTWAAMNSTEGSVIISSDALREELLGNAADQSQNGRIFDEMRSRTKAALMAGKDVYYDATNLRRKRRMALIKEMERHCASVNCVLFVLPVEICYQRNSTRDRVVPTEVIKRQLTQFEVPYYFEEFNHIEIIREFGYNQKDLIENMNIPHDSSYHEGTIKEHAERAAALANSYTSNSKIYTKNMVQAALFHDVGKPTVKTVDEKGEAHYYNHANVSAYLYLCCSNENIVDMLFTAVLIELHMRAMKNELGKLGSKLSIQMQEHLLGLVKCDILGA